MFVLENSRLEETLLMGDSSNVQVTPRRLSKPRTNKSSSSLLGEQPTTPSSSHDLDYFGSDAVVVNSCGECRSRSKSRSRIKAYLYGSGHDVAQISSDDEDAQTGISGAARDVRKRLSRTGHSAMPLLSTKASVTRLSNSSSSGLLSSRSTESQGMDPEESAMIADQIKQRAYHDSLAAQNHTSTPVDEDKHVDSIMAPLRRKSLYTPGIATRNASDILRKPPKPLTDNEYYYDPSRPETSPLSRLASLSVGEDGRSTPCDLHYSQLGGLQLGTLRVTNGASSPIPGDQPANLAYRSATPDSKIHDDIYTASEGSVTGDRDHATPLPIGGGSPFKRNSKAEGNVKPDSRVPSRPDKSLPFERESSDESFPFSRERDDQSARFERRAADHSARSRSGRSLDIQCLAKRTSNESFSFKGRSSQTCPVVAAEPKNILTFETEVPNKPCFFGNGEESKASFSVETVLGSPKSYRVDGGTLDGYFSPKSETFNEAVRFEGNTLSQSSPSKTRSFTPESVQRRKYDECFHSRRKSHNGASDIAGEYIAELESSPFSYPPLEDESTIIPQSQCSTKETDRSFVSDVAGNGSGSREDAFRKLDVDRSIPSTWKPEGLSVSAFQPSRHSLSSEIPQTDSGYSSYASLTGAPTDEAGFEAEGNPIPPAKVTALPQPQTHETVRSSARSPFGRPIRKLKKRRAKSQTPPVNLITGHHELTDATIPRIPSVIAARHATRLSEFPLLEHTFPSSQHTSGNGAWSPVQAHDAPIRFPSPANALETASAHIEPFPTTTSKSQTSTIVVDEDDWGTSNLVRSPSWSEYGGGRKRKEQKKLAQKEKETEKRLMKEERELERKIRKDKKDLERQVRKDENKQKFTRSRSASRARARSSEDQSRYDTTIADFGTVTESLGSSPYDIAKPTLPNPQVARNWHPHQISTAMPRSKPSFGARARAQTMFLDMPSVPALAAVDIMAHNLEWARARQRSQTSSAASAEPLNRIPRKVVRPHSVTMEVTPPVPDLPSANQVQRREAEIIRSRPRSMIVEAPILVPIPTSWEIEGKTAFPYPSASGTSATPHPMKGSKIVPDLWSRGSLERKSAKTAEESRQASNSFIGGKETAIPIKGNPWEAQSNAWSQRRKSAGEALLSNQVRHGFDDQEVANLTLLEEHNERPTSLTKGLGAHQTFMPTSSHLRPYPHLLASHAQLTSQQTQASNTLGSISQSTSKQTQRCGFSPLASPPRPRGSSMFSFQQEDPSPIFTPNRAQTQSFHIERKRVGSSRSTIRAGTVTGSGRDESVLV